MSASELSRSSARSISRQQFLQQLLFSGGLLQLLLHSCMFVACHMQHVQQPKAHTANTTGSQQRHARSSQNANSNRYKGYRKLLNYTYAHTYTNTNEYVCASEFVCGKSSVVPNLCAAPSVRQLRRRPFWSQQRCKMNTLGHATRQYRCHKAIIRRSITACLTVWKDMPSLPSQL